MLNEELHTNYYYKMMKTSLNDKIRLIDGLKPGNVLDVGAGGGDLSNTISHLGFEITPIDASNKSILQINKNYPKLQPIKSYTSDLLKHFEPHSFDNIICSSILHEVFSYGDNTHDPYSQDNVYETVGILSKILKPGGRLIIRDGVKPQIPKIVNLTVFNDEDHRFIAKYLEEAPYIKLNLKDYDISLTRVDDNMYVGTLQSVMEILYTLTWGFTSFDREVNEIYGVFTLPEYSSILEHYGLHMLKAEEYVQPGYVNNLQDKATITDLNGAKLSFPSTNMILIGEKRF